MRRRELLMAPLLGPVGAFAQRPLSVVASFSILADLVQEIGGPAVQVSTLVKADADAHIYSPSPADARSLAQADLVVMNGLGFEGWMQRLVIASGFRGPVLVASADVTSSTDSGHPDPHAWQDVSLVRRYVSKLCEGLSRAAPGQSSGIALRAARFDAALAILDEQVRARLAPIPRAERRVITSHDAFGYFGRAYGIDFIAPQGMNTDSEPSAAAVANLIQQVRRERVRAVFVENISDPRLINRIAREGGAHVGGRLYSDALSAPGGPADTYIRMLSHNAATLANALSHPTRSRPPLLSSSP